MSWRWSHKKSEEENTKESEERADTEARGRIGGLRDLQLNSATRSIYYNFCLPHASLRRPLSHPEATNGSGSAKQWRSQTPAMAAGLTDHVWTLREVLLFRVPPWPQPAGV